MIVISNFLKMMILRIVILLLITFKISCCLGQEMPVQKTNTLRLYFENNEYTVSSEQRDTINNYYTSNKTHLIDSIVLSGYANSIGTSQSNFLLSERRVHQAQLLVNKSTDIDKIIIKAFGEVKGDLEENRRVDVITYYKIKKPAKILRGIIFVPGTDLIKKENEEALIELLDYVNKRPESDFILYGHICCQNNVSPEVDILNESNGRMTLSSDRARAVCNYLIQNGISSERLSYLGKAYTEPLGGEDYLDRRVEIEEVRNTK